MKEFIKKYLKWSLIIGSSLIVIALIGMLFGKSKEEKEAEYKQEVLTMLSKGEDGKALNKLKYIDNKSNNFDWAQNLIDSLQLIEKEKDKKEREANLISDIKESIATLEKGIDFQPYYEDDNNIHSAVGLIDLWASQVGEGLSSDNPTVRQLAEELKSLASIKQTKEFPNLRKAIFRYIKDKVWENDIDVKLQGSRNDIMFFTGRHFVLNKNIKKFQEEQSESFHKLRFKRIKFQWSKIASEYSYWDLDSPKDSEIIK